MSHSLTGLGLVYQYQQKFDKALVHYNRGLTLKEKIGDEHGIAITKGNMALLYKMQGRKEDAKSLLEEILQYFEKMEDSLNAEITRRNLEYL